MAILSQAFCPSVNKISSMPLDAKGLCNRQPKFLPEPRKRSGPVLRISCFAKTASRSEAATVASLYTLLGLHQGVELPEIRSAYRKMARKYHPDVCRVEDKEECTKMFLQLQDAYETLSDPSRRADYDASLMRAISDNGRSWDLGMVGRGPRRSGMNSVSQEWKVRWETQLQNLTEREADHMSWGARMRARNQSS